MKKFNIGQKVVICKIFDANHPEFVGGFEIGDRGVAGINYTSWTDEFKHWVLVDFVRTNEVYGTKRLYVPETMLMSNEIIFNKELTTIPRNLFPLKDRVEEHIWKELIG